MPDRVRHDDQKLGVFLDYDTACEDQVSISNKSFEYLRPCFIGTFLLPESNMKLNEMLLVNFHCHVRANFSVMRLVRICQ
jgi:hypothetical protein